MIPWRGSGSTNFSPVLKTVLFLFYGKLFAGKPEEFSIKKKTGLRPG
jgi:hypothetical protein